jgi:hypothetical protein
MHTIVKAQMLNEPYIHYIDVKIMNASVRITTGLTSFWQDWWHLAGLVVHGRTGGTVCKVSYSLARATGRSWVQAPTAFLTRLGNKYLLKSLMMLTLHSASVLDKPP